MPLAKKEENLLDKKLRKEKKENNHSDNIDNFSCFNYKYETIYYNFVSLIEHIKNIEHYMIYGSYLNNFIKLLPVTEYICSLFKYIFCLSSINPVIFP